MTLAAAPEEASLPSTVSGTQPEIQIPPLTSAWMQCEALLDRLGDRLNPILVKEARQAMKSRQFVVTFSLLLIFGWLWTVLFIAFGVPAIFYAPVGPGVLCGYYLVLSIPLLIVVPYAAFRSLAAEREDGTYELLSITALNARQIVLGKLGSAVLQMMVYYSALAPCIAFTYLLRGIDVVSIALFLAYTFLASLLLSIFGLMMATITKARHWQVLLSVVFVMALLIFTFIWDSMFLGIILSSESLPYDQSEFWMVNACGFSFYLPVVILFLFIAAGQITFASENRSTSIRAVLLAPTALFAAWMAYFFLRFTDDDPLFVMTAFAGVYWALAAAFLTGETAQLSPRAMRQLPQTLLGRMAFTWFNPGSGTGYVFAMTNLLTFTLMGALLVTVGLIYDRITPDNAITWGAFAGCILGYVAGYLGITRLLIVAVRRVTPVSLLATFLCHVIVACGGVLFPLLIQAMVSWGNYTNFEYTLLQLPNWIWTLNETIERTTFGGGELAVIVGCAGAAVFVANLITAAREVEYVRLQAPQRVIEDDLALHPQVVKPVRKSPWDE